MTKSFVERRLQSEAEAMLQPYLFIGIIKPTQRDNIKALSSKNRESLRMWQDVLEATKQVLVDRFETLARTGGLEQLREDDYEEFAKIWRAKFGKEPKL